MPGYDATHFDPPAPVASVILRDPNGEGAIPDVALLVDTGADVTLLPRVAVAQLGVPVLADERYELTGFDGSKSVASVVILDMLFLRRTFRGRYLLIEAAQGILGRDILNHVPLLLDGPRGQWPEHLPQPV